MHLPLNAPLKYLYACADYPSCSLQKKFLSSIERLHALTHLRFVLHSDVCYDPSSPIPHSKAFVKAARGSTFPFEETAHTLTNTLPALRHVFLTTSGYLANRDDSTNSCWKAYERWFISRAWCVAHSEDVRTEAGQVVLVELDEAAAETIIYQEELVLSAADEASPT